MSDKTLVDSFLIAADAWLCDGYALDIRYIADLDHGGTKIWDASIALNPLPPQQKLGFRISTPRIAVGQIQRPNSRKSDLQKVLALAISGEIAVAGSRLRLVSDQALDIYSEMAYRDRWFSQLHLQVLGTRRPQPSSIELASADNALRRSKPPFDGLADAAAWLGIGAPGTSSNPPSIAIRVGPPVDLIFDQCGLADDQLTLTLHAHPKFDVSQVGLAVHAVPGVALEARRQTADRIKWGRVRDGRRPGVVQIELSQADNVLAMLQIEDSNVRRQWFIDPAKARNNRLLAVQHFDKELRMLRHAVLDSPDSTKFEQGVAALLFLLGYTPSLQLETDAPDLVVTTPGGRLAIVECTTRIADFASKIGKLVDRRGSLTKYLDASGHPATLVAVLVCRLPRDQIAALAEEPRAHNVILLAGEDIQAGLNRVRSPTDPDAMLESALAQLAQKPVPGLEQGPPMGPSAR